MSKKTILGIDLGTTYSCVAYINDYGRAEVIPNAEGDASTPSVVWFDGNRAVVGNEAKEMAGIQPDRVCSFVKRSMGNDEYYFEVDGVRYSPEHVSGLILRKLVKDASAHLGREIKDVVVTCPAYFFLKEREATKRAGEIAGLNVMQILNEPTAAAFAYGIAPDKNIGEQFVLVYDLGGGTFDVSVIRISEKGVDVICTDGDHQLGGKDWDDRLVRHLLQKFSEETGRFEIEDTDFHFEVLNKAEQCKKQLTDRKSTKTTLSHGGHRASIEITREEFESMSSDLLERTIELTQSLLGVARKKGCNKLNRLILVGGSSRMPQVSERLFREFSLQPQLFDPDEAVAKGAALIGNNLYLRELLDRKLERRTVGLSVDNAPAEELLLATRQVADEFGYQLETVSNATKKARNVTSKSFGITVLDGYDQEQRPILSVSNLIYRNTPLPAVCTGQYATIADRQSIIVVELVENSCDPSSDNRMESFIPLEETTALWSGELPIRPDMPKYSPINVTFEIDENGRLVLMAFDPASGGTLRKSIPEPDTEHQVALENATRHSRELIVE